VHVGETLIGTRASQAHGGRRPRAGPKQCSVEGCAKRAVARTWCMHHYNVWRHHGQVEPEGAEASWAEVGAHAQDWSELELRKWLEVRSRTRARPLDPDDPMLALARRAVTVGWPGELACWFVPLLYQHWPRADPR
jgi:hypothetical protein